MPLQDLLDERARTGSGAEVSLPTVRTFCLALKYFGSEIAALRAASKKIPGRFTVDQAITPFVATFGDGRLEKVLSGLSSHDPVGTAYAVAGMVEPIAERIDELLGDPEADYEQDSVDVDPMALYVMKCAKDVGGVDPIGVVMAWPIGFFLDVVRAFSRPAKDSTVPADYVDPLPRPVVVGGPTRGSEAN